MQILSILFTISVLFVNLSTFARQQKRQSQNETTLCPSSPVQTPVQLNCTEGPPLKGPLPPQDLLKEPPEEGPGPKGPPEGPPPPDLVPVGLDKVILLVVPQFKCPIHTKSKWWKASSKMSFPINVFFDKLVVPRDSPPLIFFPFGAFPGPREPGKVKRSVDSGSILSLPPPESVRGGERAMIVPRLEMLLQSYGLEGKGCLLRALCEIHETSLPQVYGFFGEILTLLFTVSNSAYGESHMPEYLKAEEMGRGGGGCSSYFEACPDSLFHPEEDHSNHRNSSHPESFPDS